MECSHDTPLKFIDKILNSLLTVKTKQLLYKLYK